MTIESSAQKDIIIVSLRGQIDGNSARNLRMEVASIARMAGKIVVDLSQATHLSSAGMRLLLLLYRYFLANNRGCVLMGMPEELARTMSHTGFLAFFKVAATREEAIRLLS